MPVPAGRVRMTPEVRREQLLDLGVRLLSTCSLEELSIESLAEQAGISRGLLYHYFGSKQEFHRAVTRKAADDLIAETAPSAHGDPLERLAGSLAAYVDYVRRNYAGYTSLVRAAAGGDPDLRAIHESARSALTDRIFEVADADELAALGLRDTATVRLMVRGWSAMCEEVVLSWVREDRGVSEDDLLTLLAAALPAVLTAT